MSTSIAKLIVEMAESGFGSVAGAIGKIGAAVGVAGIAAGGMGLAIAASNEQAEISFTTMLGSAEKAGGFLKELQGFAAKTPFEFPELQRAASNLVSAGFAAQDVIPIMTTLGDVTSGMGTGSEGVKRATIALQQMSAAGRITGEDLNQLRDAGIPVFDLLAGATGKSKEEIAKLAAAGKLGKAEMDAMFTALKTGGAGLERFSGLMEKQSASLSGMLATLKDTVGQGLATAMQGAVPAIKGLLGTATEALGPVMSLVGTFAGTLTPLLGVLGRFAGALATALVPVLDDMAPVMGEIGASVGELLMALVPIVPVIGDLLMAVLPLLPPLIDLATMIVPTLISALDIGKPVILAVAGAFLLFQLGSIISSMVAMVPVVLGLAGAMWTLIAPVLPIIAALAAVAAAAYLLWRNWDTVWAAVTGAIEWAGGAIGGVIDWIKGAIGDAARWISDRLGDVISFFMELPGRILGALGDLGSLLLSAGEDLIRGMINGVKNMAGALLGAAKSVVSGAVGAVKGFLGIGSPSKVFMEIGQNTIAGLIIGVASQERALGSQMGDVAGLMEGIGGTAGVRAFGVGAGGSGGYGGGGGVSINITVNVPGGFVGNEAELAGRLAPAIRDELLLTADRLPSLFAGRA